MWGVGAESSRGSCEAPELILLPWMWGQQASAANGLWDSTSWAGHPHCKLKVVSQLFNRDSDVAGRILSVHFIKSTCKQQSTVEIKEKKNTRMLRGVRPFERLMVEEMWLREKKGNKLFSLSLLSPLSSSSLLWETSLFPHVPQSRREPYWNSISRTSCQLSPAPLNKKY